MQQTACAPNKPRVRSPEVSARYLALRRALPLDPSLRDDAVRDWEEDRREFLAMNLGLIGVAIAKYYPFTHGARDDLMQEGFIGLCRAFDTYDPGRGSFGTYAIHWIRQRICFSDAKDFTIRPHRRHPPMERRQFKDVPDHLLSDPGRVGVWESSADILSWRDYLETLLARLPERTATILAMRYGLRGGEARSLQSVGDEISLTKERVRQIEARAIEKLRDMARERTYS